MSGGTEWTRGRGLIRRKKVWDQASASVWLQDRLPGVLGRFFDFFRKTPPKPLINEGKSVIIESNIALSLRGRK